MATGEYGSLAPIALVLPDIPFAEQGTPPIGTIGVSGATLVFYNGSIWIQLITGD